MKTLCRTFLIVVVLGCLLLTIGCGREQERAFSAIQADNPAALKKLVPLKVKANLADDQGRSLLFFAVGRRNLEMVKYLLESGASADNPKAFKTISPMFLAAKKCNWGVFQELYQRSVEKNQVDHTGRSLFFWAATSGCSEITSGMLDWREDDGEVERAEFIHSDHKGHTILGMLVRLNNRGMLDDFIQRGLIQPEIAIKSAWIANKNNLEKYLRSRYGIVEVVGQVDE